MRTAAGAERPPRILLLHQPVDGGVARNVADIFCGLEARGWEAWTCGPAPPSASRQSPALVPREHHVPVAMTRAIEPPEDLAALRSLHRAVRELRPDVVHAHSSKAGALGRAIKLLQPQLPVVYTAHGYAFAGYFERRRARQLYWGVERGLTPLTDRVIAVCHAEARLAYRCGAGRRVRVVHNGVDGASEGAADPRVMELRERGPLICAVSQLRPGKGVETLVQSLPEVLAEQPAAQVVLLGDGPLREPIAALARELGVAHALHFLGEHPDPTAALRAADVFVMPSWAESFPYAILEAMSVGLPVVASAVGGVGEAVTDGRSGLLVPPRDPEALGSALAALLRRARLREELADCARRRVRAEFTVQRMVDGVMSVYSELLAHV